MPAGEAEAASRFDPDAGKPFLRRRRRRKKYRGSWQAENGFRPRGRRRCDAEVEVQ